MLVNVIKSVELLYLLTLSAIKLTCLRLESFVITRKMLEV